MGNESQLLQDGKSLPNLMGNITAYRNRNSTNSLSIIENVIKKISIPCIKRIEVIKKSCQMDQILCLRQTHTAGQYVHMHQDHSILKI